MELDSRARYVDYTCATPWEFLVNDIEGILRRWMGSGFQDPPKEEPIQYDGDTLLLRLLAHDCLPRAATELGSHFVDADGDATSLRTSTWVRDTTAFPALCRWLGLRRCIVLERLEVASVFPFVTANTPSKDRSVGTTLLSALTVAVGNSGVDLPALVLVAKVDPSSQRRLQ